MKRRNGERNGEIILKYKVDAEKEENKGGRDWKKCMDWVARGEAKKRGDWNDWNWKKSEKDWCKA